MIFGRNNEIPSRPFGEVKRPTVGVDKAVSKQSQKLNK